MRTQEVQIEVTTQVNWSWWRGPSGDFVASCAPLGLTVASDTFAELNEAMLEAVHELIVDLLEDGEYDQFFQDRGWHRGPAVPVVPEGVQPRYIIPPDQVSRRRHPRV